MSAVAEAADLYREAVNAHREAKASLALHLAYALKTGRTVQELADETGYSRQRIYQLLAVKEKS